MDTNKTNQDKNQAATPKKRGRPKGVKVGPRAIIWACSEVIDSELVSAVITAANPEAAKAEFNKQYGQEPSSVQGPFYAVMSAQQSPSKSRRRETLALDTNEIRMGGPLGRCIFDGWYGQALSLQGHEDLLFFIPFKPVAETEKKRTPPRARAVPKAEVELQS